ncbi:MAG: ATP-binding cassette domain-containing protein, partial [Anaerolineaceae bacterium]|nr:ATP-binding cassette domain-containing protein [Anaerolineaceae bacterium]
MLKVENINFFYGEIQVLSDISLKVEEGEFVVIFGPNGHGKSTLLKVICGLLKPVSGTIKY